MKTRTGFLITQIKQVQGRVFQRLLHNCGIDAFNGAQGRILYILWKKDSVPITALVQETGLAKNTLTAMLARMEGQGLITRQDGIRDRRQTVISLTEKARALKGPYEQVSEEMNGISYQGLTQEDAALLDSLPDKVLANLTLWEMQLKDPQKTGGKSLGKTNRKNRE